MRTALLTALAATALLAPILSADSTVPTDLATRLRGASRVVVGSVARVEPRLVQTASGDRIIVSRTWVRVEEALKGRADAMLAVDLEGGTIGDISMRASDITPLVVGERAVLLVEPTPDGAWRPHRRGLGLLRLTPDNRLRDLNLSLGDVRRAAAGVR